MVLGVIFWSDAWRKSPAAQLFWCPFKGIGNIFVSLGAKVFLLIKIPRRPTSPKPIMISLSGWLCVALLGPAVPWMGSRHEMLVVSARSSAIQPWKSWKIDEQQPGLVKQHVPDQSSDLGLGEAFQLFTELWKCWMGTPKSWVLPVFQLSLGCILAAIEWRSPPCWSKSHLVFPHRARRTGIALHRFLLLSFHPSCTWKAQNDYSRGGISGAKHYSFPGISGHGYPDAVCLNHDVGLHPKRSPPSTRLLLAFIGDNGRQQ